MAAAVVGWWRRSSSSVTMRDMASSMGWGCRKPRFPLLPFSDPAIFLNFHFPALFFFLITRKRYSFHIFFVINFSF